MDNSTERVTLFSGFIFDVLATFKESRETFAAPLFEMASHLDAENPQALAPMQLYNDMCQWIEDNLGPANLRKVGVAIGNRAYGQMTADGALGANPTPVAVLEELKRVAGIMIQDPKGRDWELREVQAKSVLMRRTQTYNCILQEGLLDSLVKRTGVLVRAINQECCTRRGDEFCEYRVSWW